jgi:hypothetical protein
MNLPNFRTSLVVIFAELFIAALIVTLLSVSGCGSVTLQGDAQALGASVDVEQTVGADAGVEDGQPDGASAATDLPSETETHPSIDAGASLPICPEAIGHQDCPQPKCDCQDR